MSVEKKFLSNRNMKEIGRNDSKSKITCVKMVYVFTHIDTIPKDEIIVGNRIIIMFYKYK